MLTSQLPFGTLSGNFVSTQQPDNVYESITETVLGGKKSNRYDKLEHVWSIQLSNGNHVFNVQAYYTGAGDNDNGFDFSWSTEPGDPDSWAPILTVTETSDDGTYETADLGALSGTIYIRVVDNNRTPGQQSPNTLFIDHMFVDGGDPVTDPPGVVTNPDPADGAPPVSVTPTLSWSASVDASTYNVHIGTDALLLPFVTNVSATSFAPGLLAPNTAYYWRIDAVNALGTTTGAVWSFTTDGATTQGSLHVAGITLDVIGLGQGKKRGRAVITVIDDQGTPVQDATVSGTFTGAFDEVGSGVTDTNGQATIITTGVVKGSASYTFCVGNIVSLLTYEPGNNVETCDTF